MPTRNVAARKIDQPPVAQNAAGIADLAFSPRTRRSARACGRAPAGESQHQTRGERGKRIDHEHRAERDRGEKSAERRTDAHAEVDRETVECVGRLPLLGRHRVRDRGETGRTKQLGAAPTRSASPHRQRTACAPAETRSTTVPDSSSDARIIGSAPMLSLSRPDIGPATIAAAP